MFYLSLIEHTLRLPPERLNSPLAEAMKEELEILFLDKVIANLGLCISVYDIKKIEGGFIFAGDGASTYTVEFRLIMFRPFVGEIIDATLKQSDADGLRLSLGFFDDIIVPPHLLPSPCHCEPDPSKRFQKIWSWDFKREDDQEDEPLFVFDGADKIRFRVVNVNYPPIPVEEAADSKPFAPMTITGAVDVDGLGPVSWW